MSELSGGAATQEYLRGLANVYPRPKSDKEQILEAIAALRDGEIARLDNLGKKLDALCSEFGAVSALNPCGINRLEVIEKRLAAIENKLEALENGSSSDWLQTRTLLDLTNRRLKKLEWQRTKKRKPAR